MTISNLLKLITPLMVFILASHFPKTDLVLLADERQLSDREAHPQQKEMRKVLDLYRDSSKAKLQPELADDILPTQNLRTVLRATAELVQPATIRAGAGHFDLNVQFARNRLGNDEVELRSYNGRLVGPTIRVRAGESIALTLNNQLPNEGGTGQHRNEHHEWNTTNLHTHGLHVAPQGTSQAESDNVLIQIAPQQSQRYEIRVPNDHVAGTFWYHAHKHGAVSAQVSSGMAGALVVERGSDSLDDVPEIAAAAEQIMVLQQIPYVIESDGVGRLQLANAGRMFGPNTWHRSGRYTTINGQQLPVIRMRPGEVQRWRLIHSGFRELLSLELHKENNGVLTAERIPFHEIAVDGLPLGVVEPKIRLSLWPGYRSDSLVKAPLQVGTYVLVDEESSSSLMGGSEPLKYVAKLQIEGEPMHMELPANRDVAEFRLPSITDDEIAGAQEAFYGITAQGFVIGQDPGRPNRPVRNGREYSPRRSRDLTLGDAEEWVVGTRNAAGINAAHPFHIHVNPFEVISIDGRMLDRPVWRDTLVLPQGSTIRFRTRYEDFTGDFVQHCHVLDHEDQGMMELVRIRSRGPEPNGTAVDRTMTIAKAELIDADGKQWEFSDFRGETLVALLIKGAYCPHCLEQVAEFAERFDHEESKVIVVTSETSDDLAKMPKSDMLLLANPDHNLFRRLGAYDNGPEHGTFVLDAKGKRLFADTGPEPFMEVETVLAAAFQDVEPSVVVAIRETDQVNDDYLTWAPTTCSVRVENGDPNQPPIDVTITSSASAPSEAGTVRFARTLNLGQTATQQSIPLELPQDGTPVEFLVAGKKASELTRASLLEGGRDAVIEVREGSASGRIMGSAKAMVRVRKDIRTLNPLELDEFLGALMDLNRSGRFEWYVELHRYATGMMNANTPDQAHQGFGFIAWHRAFLLQFEREIQRSSPHVALPYWVQGTSQTFFDDRKLGEPGTVGPIVRFRRGSPLYGFSINLAHEPAQQSSPIMGQVERTRRNHNTYTPSTGYRQWNQFLGIRNIHRFSEFSLRVEGNPHNNGHTTVGPRVVWMYNCRESNADPVFYVFHCNHDYLWARWQYHFNRFRTDGTDSNHYFPNDAFSDPTANKNFPLGHHLFDRMWPWDGTAGPAGHPNARRPSPNPYGDFPAASPFDDLWPGTSSGSPRPVDTIDYLGMTSRSNNLGFCYDNIEFGHRTQPVPFASRQADEARMSLSAKIFTDKNIRHELRLEAAQQLVGDIIESNSDEFQQVVQDAETPDDLRSEAFRLLTQAVPSNAVAEGARILADADVSAELGVSVLEQLGSMMHFSQLSRDEMMQINESFRSALTNANAEHVQAAALRHLAPSGDESAKTRLLSIIEDQSSSSIPATEAIFLLKYFPSEYGTLRDKLSSNNESWSIAAIQALFKDGPSLQLRQALAGDRSRGNELRRTAIQSLMFDDVNANANKLVEIFANTKDQLDVRSEAIAAAGVLIKRRYDELSERERASLLEAIDAVETTKEDASEIGKLKSVALDALRQ